MGFLLNGEEEFLLQSDERGLAFGVFVKFQLGFIHKLAHVWIFEVAEEGLGAWLAEFEFEKRASGFSGVAGLDEFFDLAGKPIAKRRLFFDQLIDEGLESVVLVGRDGGRAGDDERRSRFVDQDIVDFVDDRKVSAALHLLKTQPQHHARLQENIRHFRIRAEAAGLPMLDSQTAIQPLMAGDNERALQWSAQLRDAGFWVSAIRPPTVPQGKSRLRITLTTLHTTQQIDALVKALAEITGGHDGHG